jgi:hypothetical protein
VWEKLNVEGMVKITALVAEIANKLARAEEPPAFAPLISPAPEA